MTDDRYKPNSISDIAALFSGAFAGSKCGRNDYEFAVPRINCADGLVVAAALNLLAQKEDLEALLKAVDRLVDEAKQQHPDHTGAPTVVPTRLVIDLMLARGKFK